MQKTITWKIEEMEKVSPEIFRKEQLLETVRSFPVLYDKSHKEFKEKEAKNAWDGVVTALEFIPTGNYFYFISSNSFFESILFIWLNSLVPGVPNLYPQYQLILSI